MKSEMAIKPLEVNTLYKVVDRNNLKDFKGQAQNGDYIHVSSARKNCGGNKDHFYEGEHCQGLYTVEIYHDMDIVATLDVCGLQRGLRRMSSCVSASVRKRVIIMDTPNQDTNPDIASE